MGKKFTITISLILVMLLAFGSLSVISAQEVTRIGLEAEMTRYKLWCAVIEDKLFIFLSAKIEVYLAPESWLAIIARCPDT